MHIEIWVIILTTNSVSLEKLPCLVKFHVLLLWHTINNPPCRAAVKINVILYIYIITLLNSSWCLLNVDIINIDHECWSTLHLLGLFVRTIRFVTGWASNSFVVGYHRLSVSELSSIQSPLLLLRNIFFCSPVESSGLALAQMPETVGSHIIS